MKYLVALMLFLSLCMGISTNKGWITLYDAEFSVPIYSIKEESFNIFNIVHWGILLLSHALVASLFFLTKHSNFTLFLIWFPLQFIFVFASFNLLASFLLIPFIIMWIVTMNVSRKQLD